MEKLLALLKDPFDGVSDNNSLSAKCEKIAVELFNNYGIKCGDKIFCFAEIEFYYYDKNAYQNNKYQFRWQKVTYPRDGYDAGQLFYHLSGIDICFNSHYKNDPVKFGGILIRALKGEDGIIAGPLTCKDVILNACINGEMPKLVKETAMQNIVPKQTYRSLGKTGTDKEHDRLCFYDAGKENTWNPVRDRFVTESGRIERKKGSYDTSKFSI